MEAHKVKGHDSLFLVLNSEDVPVITPDLELDIELVTDTALIVFDEKKQELYSWGYCYPQENNPIDCKETALDVAAELQDHYTGERIRFNPKTCIVIYGDKVETQSYGF